MPFASELPLLARHVAWAMSCSRLKKHDEWQPGWRGNPVAWMQEYRIAWDAPVSAGV